jgi:hypothetical protein
VIRCAYCGKRAHAHLAGRDSRSTAFDVNVCPQCGPIIAACLTPPTARLTWLPDHRTAGRAVRLALLWAVIIIAAPVVMGMLYAAIEMLGGR